MAEILNGRGIKTIAYYLPQFHAIPENDKAWGEGFTEWVNTKKAKPMFSEHYQPREPLNDNYYNLLDDNTKIWQSDLAQKYGLFGFCYYHYWFKDGKMLLEKPAEQMLKNKEVTIPFCFSWANENWSKRWDGGNKELIAEQDYGNETDWKRHLEYLLSFFRDERYITLDSKPVFIIYKPEEIPHVNEMLAFWNNEIKKEGFSGICFMIQNPNWFFMPSYKLGNFDYQIKFHPFFALGYKDKDMNQLYRRRKIYQVLKKMHMNWIVDSILPGLKTVHHNVKGDQLKQLNYDEIWEIILNSESSQEFIEGAFVDWDNTSRKKNGYVNIGANPQKFDQYMKRLYKKVEDEKQQPVVFINAWNEWCEGAYLEPDKRYGYEYLEALKKANEK